MMRLLSQAIHALTSTIYPHVCEICGTSLVRTERHLCLICLDRLPRTNSHLDPNSRIIQRLSRLYPIRRSASWFYYDADGSYACLIRRAKYDDRPELGADLGEMFASEIRSSGFFDGIQLIVPIPLHYSRLIKRGYNQSLAIAKGITRIVPLPINTSLRASRPHFTQARNNVVERAKNLLGTFSLNHPRDLDAKHILIVDDVFTTGATLEAAITAITSVSHPASISIFTLGLTRLRR